MDINNVIKLADPVVRRNCVGGNWGKTFEQVDSLAPFRKEIMRLGELDYPMSVDDISFAGQNEMIAEFNIGDHWYVLSGIADNGSHIWTLQENLCDGEIDYLVDQESFIKVYSRIKKILS